MTVELATVIEDRVEDKEGVVMQRDDAEKESTRPRSSACRRWCN